MSTTGNRSRPARRMEPAAAQPVRPQLGVADLLLQLWRTKWLMLLVFVLVFLVGVIAALVIPQSFEAQSRLLVSSGEGHIYRPDAGPDRIGALPDRGPSVLSEVELIRSPVVVERALEKFPLSRIYPRLAETCERKRQLISGAAEQVRQLEDTCRQQAVQILSGHFRASAVPSVPVVTVRFTHDDPEIAAEMLNALIGAYFGYRADIFTDTRTSGIFWQRERIAAELKLVEEELGRFLVTNEIGNFDTERATLRQLYQIASSDLLQAESRARQVQGQLSAYRRQIKSIDPQQDIYVEHSNPQVLLNLRLERAEKLTRYPLESKIIQDLDRRIAAAETHLNVPGASGTVRRGPNPLYQEIEASLAVLSAEAEALSEQKAELRRQIADFEARQQALGEIEPEYQELVHQRDILAQNVLSLTEREVEARAFSELARQSASSIRVLEPARTPIRGHSLERPFVMFAFLLAVLMAFGAGLFRALTRPVFSTSGAVERTLGLPVLAAVRRYR